MNENMLEILISKHIDSEITPAEQHLLDCELKKNSEAKNLLERYQQLDQLARQVIGMEVEKSCQSCEEIFGKAIAEHRPQSRWRRLVFSSRLRIPTSIAAGFLVGLLSLHAYTLLYKQPTKTPVKSSQSIVVPKNQHADFATEKTPRTYIPASRQSSTDYYTFTDPSGSRWLLETQRQGDYDLASYTGDL